MKNKIDKKIIAESYRDIANNIKPIDDQEKEMLESWKNTTEGDIEVFADNKYLKEFKQAQNEYKVSKDKSISLRLNTNIINNIKKMANDLGLSYQSYIGVILTQVAKGNIKIKVE